MMCSTEDVCLAFSFVNETSECRLHNNTETKTDAESAYYEKNAQPFQVSNMKEILSIFFFYRKVDTLWAFSIDQRIS